MEVTGLTYALSSMMGARQVLACYAGFAALGGWARWVLQPLRTPSAAAAEAEAGLRAGAVRVCEHAEEVESMRGKGLEAADLRWCTMLFFCGERDCALYFDETSNGGLLGGWGAGG